MAEQGVAGRWEKRTATTVAGDGTGHFPTGSRRGIVGGACEGVMIATADTWAGQTRRASGALSALAVLLALGLALEREAAVGASRAITDPSTVRNFRRVPPHARTLDGRAIHVVDGDTVDVDGVRHRLVGLDAPEIFHARCPAERDRGILAAARLIALLAEGGVRVVDVEGREKWGRRLARLEGRGRDLAGALVAEGHARPYDGRAARQSWCANL